MTRNKNDNIAWASVDAKALGTSPLAVRVMIDGHITHVPRSLLRDQGEGVDTVIRSRKFMAVVELEVAEWKAIQAGWV